MTNAECEYVEPDRQCKRAARYKVSDQEAWRTSPTLLACDRHVLRLAYDNDMTEFTVTQLYECDCLISRGNYTERLESGARALLAGYRSVAAEIPEDHRQPLLVSCAFNSL